METIRYVLDDLEDKTMEHTANIIFQQLAIILGLSTALGFIIRYLKLPLLVAYLLAGVLLSLLTILNLHSSPALSVLPEIGIAFVLFFIGMELDLDELKSLGLPILFSGLGQIIIATISGYVLASSLGFNLSEALFLGMGLSISSTMVVVKLLLEKKDLTSLYGKLALGITLLEDLVSVVILMVLTVGSSVLHLGLQSSMPLMALVLKGVALFIFSLVLSRYVLTTIFRVVAKSQELLFLTALSWCFLFVTLSVSLGFSVVIGAFLAGVALANSPFHIEIQGKVKPLRDFFVLLFFVYLGSQVRFSDLPLIWPIIVVFTAFALFFKPIIFMLFLGSFGFRKHTIFQSSLSLAQISEFSLIIMVVGFKMGIVTQVALTAMALIGVVSIILSSVLIASSKRIYKVLSPALSFFEHNKFVAEIEKKDAQEGLEDHVILIGAHRMGSSIVSFLKKERINFLVVDFNPKIVQKLVEQKVTTLYGDISDPELLDYLNLNQAKLIISTASYKDDNLMLLNEIKKRRIAAVVITRAISVEDAKDNYKAGADFVILPEIIAGDFILEHLKTHWFNLSYFKNRAEIELKKLPHNHLA